MLRHPATIALLIQVVSLLITGSLVVSQSIATLSLFEWCLVQAVLAGSISFIARMPMWWIPMHLVFTPLIVVTLTLTISPTWFLVLFLALLLVYGKSFKTQVPLYLSSRQVNQALASLLPQQKSFSFIDLGSGCGGLLIRLAETHRNGSFIGIESAPIPFFISRLRSIFQASCNILWGDFWKQDFSQYDVVYAYLSPVPMPQLWQKAKKEMRTGSLLISNTFIIPGVKPDKSIPLNDFSNSTLYLWRI